MFKAKILVFFVLASLMLSLWGCDQLNKLTSSNDQTTTTPSDVPSQPVPDFSATPSYGGALTTIGFDLSNFGVSLSWSMAFAKFGQPGIDAGAVTVNGDSVGKKSYNGSTYYSSFDSNSPLSLSHVAFDSSAHTWIVSGSSGIPALTASIVSPKTFSITKPAMGDTISKSSGALVTWTSPGTADSMMIVIKGSGSTTFVKAGIANSGSYQLTADNFSTLTAGPAILFVVKYRYTLKVSNSKVYAITSEVVKQNSIVIR
jgi:hypothetical protein